MNFILRILLLFIFSYYFGFFNAWWIIIIFPIIIGYLFIDNLISHFISGFLGVSLAWLSLILQLDNETASILSIKITKVLSLDNNILLIIFASIIGGLLGGIGSMLGQSIRQIYYKEKNQDPYSE